MHPNVYDRNYNFITVENVSIAICSKYVDWLDYKDMFERWIKIS